MLTVAIVGRPNVGKSTLFNRLAGKRLALVDDTPGLTRDYREADGRLGHMDFRVIDTPGLEESAPDAIEAGMTKQTERAVEKADVVLFVIDARAGLVAADRHFAEWLRRHNTPIILVANKCEGRQASAGIMESYELGIGEPVPFSAEHGDGLGDLADALLPHFDAATAEIEEEEGDRRIHLAIVGRPNAGKSTLVNALLGEARVLTSEIPGTTRDAIATDWEFDGTAYRLIDTAGLRRQARIDDDIERMAATDTLRQIRLAQVVVLLMDGNTILDKQDLTIAKHVIEEGRALVVAVNKWDAVASKGDAIQRLKDRLMASLAQVRGVPTVTLSALKRHNLDGFMATVLSAYKVWDTRISTAQLNRFLEGMTEGNPPPLANGRTNRLRYMTQVKARPPTFVIWASQPEELPDNYQRYLSNGLREAFDMPGVPIRLLFRRSKNPFVDK